LIKPDQHINNILRQKFQNFEPEPPGHVWANIEKTLDAEKSFLVRNIIYVAAGILVIILLSAGYFSFYSTSNTMETEQFYLVMEKQNNIETTKVVIEEEQNDKSTVTDIETISEDKLLVEPVITAENNEIIVSETQEKEISEGENLNMFTLKKGFNETAVNANIDNMNKLSITSIYSLSYGQPYSSKGDDIFAVSKDNNKTNSGHWENTFFISPEFSLTNHDSITILNSYSIGMEASRYFNDNWFVRFGINASYTGDRGFAKIDYISNDLMGTYDDVYDVSFDTINGIITPYYHTKSVEVWDSIRHISVSEVTNRYLFAQVPVLLGYKNSIGQFNWYVYSGPAIGFQIAKWIDEPSVDGKEIEILDLNNKLPIRSTINYQLWIGGGIEYKLGQKSSLVIEPSYRYYFQSLYSDADYKFNTSGFALRFGFNYKLGH